MNGEKKTQPGNLNTIYEEFDLSDRIKALKGKHIKIKKIVKKEDGNYSIRDSSLLSEQSMEQTSPFDYQEPKPTLAMSSPKAGVFENFSSGNILGDNADYKAYISKELNDNYFKKITEARQQKNPYTSDIQYIQQSKDHMSNNILGTTAVLFKPLKETFTVKTDSAQKNLQAPFDPRQSMYRDNQSTTSIELDNFSPGSKRSTLCLTQTSNSAARAVSSCRISNSRSHCRTEYRSKRTS
jgi:hypothetical protein